MNILPFQHGPSDGDIFAHIAEALQETGYIVLTDVFATELLQTLFLDIKQTDSDEFHEAGIGRYNDHQLNNFVRRDRIHWLDCGYAPVRPYLDWMERLRQTLNQNLFLGLFDYECHYAHYQCGAFYKKHYDAFRGESIRRLSTILYLNPSWQPQDGGELVLYDEQDTTLQTVAPSFGKLVIFLSEEFPHEVLPTHCSRYSLTGWFRINNSDAQRVDPPV